MIDFRTTSDGFCARIEDLEITFGNIGFTIVVWEDFSYVPCVYGDCPEGRKPATCPIINACPYEYYEEGQSPNYCEGGFNSFDEVITRVRTLLKSGRKALGGRFSWSPSAAARFLNEPWNYDEAALASPAT